MTCLYFIMSEVLSGRLKGWGWNLLEGSTLTHLVASAGCWLRCQLALVSPRGQAASEHGDRIPSMNV